MSYERKNTQLMTEPRDELTEHSSRFLHQEKTPQQSAIRFLRAQSKPSSFIRQAFKIYDWWMNDAISPATKGNTCILFEYRIIPGIMKQTETVRTCWKDWHYGWFSKKVLGLEVLIPSKQNMKWVSNSLRPHWNSQLISLQLIAYEHKLELKWDLILSCTYVHFFTATIHSLLYFKCTFHHDLQ